MTRLEVVVVPRELYYHEIGYVRDLEKRAAMERELEYAERLAIHLWEKHYKTDAPHWKPLSGDLIGILTQIDNMVAGLVRPNEETQ